MIEKFTDGFRSLVRTFKTSPIASLVVALFLLTGFSLYWSSINASALERLLDDPSRNTAHFEQALQRNEQIDGALINLRSDTNSQKVVVRQFHNGKKDLTGLPFTYISTTHISQPDNASNSAGTYESQPLSTMNGTLRYMWGDAKQPKCIVLNTDESTDFPHKAYLDETGIKISVICPLVNLLNYPIGIVSVGYTKQLKISDELAVQSEVSRVASKLEGYLEVSKDTDASKILGIF